MAKFLFTPTIYSEKVITARIGGNAAGTRANDYDTGKFVKLGATPTTCWFRPLTPLKAS
jgi:hypothetical protein